MQFHLQKHHTSSNRLRCRVAQVRFGQWTRLVGKYDGNDLNIEWSAFPCSMRRSTVTLHPTFPSRKRAALTFVQVTLLRPHKRIVLKCWQLSTLDAEVPSMWRHQRQTEQRVDEELGIGCWLGRHYSAPIGKHPVPWSYMWRKFGWGVLLPLQSIPHTLATA